jgi:hypothetical protein
MNAGIGCPLSGVKRDGQTASCTRGHRSGLRWYWATTPPQRSVNHRALFLLLYRNNRSGKMGDILRTVMHAISAARAKRRHGAQRDKLEDKLVADLETLVDTYIKRAREQAERGQNEIGRTA